MSDGTLKLFAYLLMLEDPSPLPFLCIEEPENGLYHKLLETLVEEFREHATGRKGGSQIFTTTHQPYFVDALEPQEVWILEKDSNGFSKIRRASDDILVLNMLKEGVNTVVLYFEKGKKTQKTWFYQLNLDRNLGKTNPLNENDLAEFVELQKTQAESENSWTVNIKDIDHSTFDLSAKNPNTPEEEP